MTKSRPARPFLGECGRRWTVGREVGRYVGRKVGMFEIIMYMAGVDMYVYIRTICVHIYVDATYISVD